MRRITKIAALTAFLAIGGLPGLGAATADAQTYGYHHGHHNRGAAGLGGYARPFTYGGGFGYGYGGIARPSYGPVSGYGRFAPAYGIPSYSGYRGHRHFPGCGH